MVREVRLQPARKSCRLQHWGLNVGGRVLRPRVRPLLRYPSSFFHGAAYPTLMNAIALQSHCLLEKNKLSGSRMLVLETVLLPQRPQTVNELTHKNNRQT